MHKHKNSEELVNEGIRSAVDILHEAGLPPDTTLQADSDSAAMTITFSVAETKEQLMRAELDEETMSTKLVPLSERVKEVMGDQA